MDLSLHKTGPLANLVDFNDIRSEIRPFDLVAFRGGDLVSDLISILERYEVGVGDFTHVGMIITADILPVCTLKDGTLFKLDPSKLYLYQSTLTYEVPHIFDGMNDVTTHKGCLGIGLYDLEEVIPIYICNKDAKVAHCKLIDNPWEPYFDQDENYGSISLGIRREQIRADFTAFYEQYQGRLYELDPLSLLGVVFPSLRGIRDMQDYVINKLIKRLRKWGMKVDKNFVPANWTFCSELVSSVYKLIGVMPESINPENILPITFFGNDGNKGIVCAPQYIKDWDIDGKKAVKY